LVSIESGLAQSGAKPLDPNAHFGEAADPTVWPTSSVGKLTILFSNNLVEFCTGALVAPNVVLTAAHCLFPGGRNVPGVKLAAPGSVHFSAGLNRGVPLAHSVAERFEVSQEFQPSHDQAVDWKTAGGDWALVVLKDALALKPIPVHSPTSEEVQKISAAKSATQLGYGPDRLYMPSVFRNCEIQKTPLSSVLLHRCFKSGYGGAPILSDFNSQPAIIGIGAFDVLKNAPDSSPAIACSAWAFAARIEDILQQK
jgi:Trypsin